MDTDRLTIRAAREADRDRFVELFTDEQFMVFSGGVLTPERASARFDEMLQRAAEIPFAKQPVIVRSSGTIIGYAGVNRFDFEGAPRLEFGWRLVPEARGHGYATEAVRALLDVASSCFEGEILAMIDPRNAPSRNVALKVGFEYWKQAVVGGFLDDIYRITVPAGAPRRGRRGRVTGGR